MLANAKFAILATLSPPIDDGITRFTLQPGDEQPVMDASPAPMLVYVHPPELSPIAVFAGAPVAINRHAISAICSDLITLVTLPSEHSR